LIHSPQAFDYPDPNRWLEGRRHEYPPVLAWRPAWDALADRFEIPKRRRVIGAHVCTETARYYGYVKDLARRGVERAFRPFRR
jgi:hypothetical protein